MNEPWPDNVFDCALRLAKSLGYEEIDVSHHKGRVYVFCAEKSDGFTEKISELYNTPVTPLWAIFDGDWRELDPRDPTVWGALIGYHGVDAIFFQQKVRLTSHGVHKGDFTAYNKEGMAFESVHPGLAVCEAYNNLKGHPRRGR